LGSHVDNGILICPYKTEGKYIDIESQTGDFAKAVWYWFMIVLIIAYVLFGRKFFK